MAAPRSAQLALVEWINGIYVHTYVRRYVYRYVHIFLNICIDTNSDIDIYKFYD